MIVAADQLYTCLACTQQVRVGDQPDHVESGCLPADQMAVRLAQTAACPNPWHRAATAYSRALCPECPALPTADDIGRVYLHGTGVPVVLLALDSDNPLHVAVKCAEPTEDGVWPTAWVDVRHLTPTDRRVIGSDTPAH